MKREPLQRVALGFGLLAMLAHAPSIAQPNTLSAEEAQKIGVEAVVYGLPLVVMDLTKRITTKLGRCLQGSRVGLPMFQLDRLRLELTCAPAPRSAREPGRPGTRA
jgi:hypothetical protein